MIQVEIRWPINPFRGDRFAEGWRPAAELALDFGATDWRFTRNLDGRLDFVQRAAGLSERVRPVAAGAR